jgi:hypothetical protein
MDRIRNPSDSASLFDLHDPLLEQTLSPSRHYESFTLGLWKMTIRFDLRLDMMLPDFQINISNLHRCLECRSGGQIIY